MPTMAKHMAEREPLTFFQRIAEAAKKFAEQESKKKKVSVSEENALQELIDRARAKFTKDKEVIKAEAKEWVKKARSSKPEEFVEAQKQVQQDRYQIRFDASDGKLRESVALVVLRTQAPDWLKAEAATIEHSPIAAEFIARITILPKELQEDPHVLHREAARFYWSTDWDGITNEARKEARSVLDRTFEKIRARVQEIAVAEPDGEVVQQFGAVNERSLMQGIDRRIDLYRTRRMEPLPDSELGGEPPKDKVGKVDKMAPGYKSWREKRAKVVQRQQLERTLLEFQRQIDRPGASNLETQRELMDDLLTDLRGGLKRDINVEDVDFDIKYTVQKYNSEAQKYIDLATKQREVTKVMITAEREENAIGRSRRGGPPVPNRLYYPEAKALGIIKNPYGFLQSERAKLQKLFEKGPDDAAYKQMEEEFAQLEAIYTGQGLIDLLQWDIEHHPQDWSLKDLEEFKNNQGALVEFCNETLLPEVRGAMNHMRLAFMLQNADDMGERGDGKKIEGIAKAIGESGVLLTRQRYNGITDDIIRHYINPEHVDHVLLSESGKMARHKPGETYDEIKRAVCKRLIQDSGLFEDRWETYYKERSEGAGKNEGKLAVYFKKNMDPKDASFNANVEQIVDEALMYYKVQLGENKNVIRRGLTPREGAIINQEQNLHNFPSSWEEKLIAASKHWDYMVQKYFADEEPRNTIAWHRIDGYSSARPEFAAAANKEAVRNWDKMERLKQKVKGGVRIDELKEADDPGLFEFINELKITYLTLPQRRQVFDGENMNHYVRNLTREDYEQQVRIHMAIPLYEATMDCSYEFAESSWREENSILRILKKTGMYTDEQLDDWKNNQCVLGEMWGRKKAREWFAPTGRSPEGPGQKERDDYLRILYNNVSHAPHVYASIDAVVDGKEQFADPKYKWDRIKEVNIRYHQIETAREHANTSVDPNVIRRMSKLDYFHGLSAEEETLCRKLWEKVPINGSQYTLTFDEYVAIQKQLAQKYLDGFKPEEKHDHWGKDGGGENIEKFAAMRFGRHMVHTVLNDVPWHDIDRTKVSVDSKHGHDAGDAFSRYFRDNTSKASDAAQALIGTYQLDRKKVDENVMVFNEISSGITDASVGGAVRGIVLMQEALTKEEFDMVGMVTRGDAFTSYEQRVLGSDLSPARNKIQMRERFEEVAQNGHPELTSPYFWNAAEKKAGITNWDQALGGHHGLIAQGLNTVDSFYEERIRPGLPGGLARRMDTVIGNKSYHGLTHFLDKNIPSHVTLYRGKNLVIYGGLLIGLVIVAEAQQKNKQESH